MDATTEQLKSLELREELLKREREMFYNLQEENFKRTYDLANKALDSIDNDTRSKFDRKLLIILLLGFLAIVALDRIGYYWTDYSVEVENKTSNINHNENKNSD